MPKTDRQRLVTFFADSERFKTDMCSTLELGIFTLEDIRRLLAPLDPFFDRAERGEYPLDTMKDADLRALSIAIGPLRYESAAYRLASYSAPFPRPDWAIPEVYADMVSGHKVARLFLGTCWRTFAEELREGWDPVILSRLPREVTMEQLRTELWYALGMAMHGNTGLMGVHLWPLLEAPILLYLGAALAREDKVTADFRALLPHLLRILPIGPQPGPMPYGGPLLCAVA
jgi:hypothetical protein